MPIFGNEISTYRRLRTYRFLGTQYNGLDQNLQAQDTERQRVAREALVKSKELYDYYDGQITLWTWPFSFVPGNHLYSLRNELRLAIEKLAAQIKFDIQLRKQKENVDLTSTSKRDIHYFPGWVKTILVVAFFVAFIAVALTGIGALVATGFIGTAAAGFVLSNAAWISTILSFTASPIYLGIASGVSLLAASLLFNEWQRPGYLLRFVPFIGRHATQYNVMYGFEEIMHKVLIAQGVSDAVSPRHDGNLSAKYFIRAAVNPLRLIEMILQSIQGFVFLAAEIGAEPGQPSSMIRSGIKQFFSEWIIGLAMAPVSFLKVITDIPFYVVKTLIFDPNKILDLAISPDRKLQTLLDQKALEKSSAGKIKSREYLVQEDLDRLAGQHGFLNDPAFPAAREAFLKVLYPRQVALSVLASHLVNAGSQPMSVPAPAPIPSRPGATDTPSSGDSKPATATGVSQEEQGERDLVSLKANSAARFVGKPAPKQLPSNNGVAEQVVPSNQNP